MNDPCRFETEAFGAFGVTRRTFDTDSRTLSLHYAFEHGPEFVESVTFESEPATDRRAGGPGATGPGFERALLHLHIAAGTSYYKVAAPDEVVIDDGLSPSEAAFHRHLYDDGLREFAVSNGLAVPLPVSIRPARIEPPGPAPVAIRPGGLLVPIGGGGLISGMAVAARACSLCGISDAAHGKAFDLRQQLIALIEQGDVEGFDVSMKHVLLPGAHVTEDPGRKWMVD